MIRVYKDNPTAGAADGTLVSTGTGADPIESGPIRVPASGYENGAWITLAVRCDPTFETVLDEGVHVALTIVNADHRNKWRLAPDDGSGDPDTAAATDWDGAEYVLNITDQVDDTNTLFHAQARVHEDESPSNDDSVDIRARAVVGAQ